jgi:NADH-quinone oxidoreductase subunit C
MSERVLKKVSKKFKQFVLDSHSQCGDDTIIISRDGLREVMTFLRDDSDCTFEMLVDLTGVDYLPRQPRFEVVYHLLSISKSHRLRVKVRLEEADPRLDSISDLWGSANWAEREAFDMYGILFDGHPDLRRLLMYEEFEGFPLRKDYPLHASQPRIDLLSEERPTTNMYSPNFGEYSPDKENR